MLNFELKIMKLKLQIIAILLLLTGITGKAQDLQTKQLFELAGKSINWEEGFKRNLGGNEFSYHSFRNDVWASIISRCNAEQSTIEWETEYISKYMDENEYGFLWIAALDLTNDKQIFDVYINEVKRFEIVSSTQRNWQ